MQADAPGGALAGALANADAVLVEAVLRDAGGDLRLVLERVGAPAAFRKGERPAGWIAARHAHRTLGARLGGLGARLGLLGLALGLLRPPLGRLSTLLGGLRALGPLFRTPGALLGALGMLLGHVGPGLGFL